MMKNKQDIIFKYHLLQQKVFWKILEKVFITKKLTQCKTSRTLKTDGLEIPDNKNISKHELLSLDQDNSSSDSLLLQCPIPRAFLPPHHLCQVLPQSTETLLQHNLHRVLPRFPYFVLPNSTTCHYKYWIYQSICQVKPMKFIVKLYSDYNTLQWKHASHQKADSSRGTSLSKLANTVNNNSIFNSKYA